MGLGRPTNSQATAPMPPYQVSVSPHCSQSTGEAVVVVAHQPQRRRTCQCSATRTRQAEAPAIPRHGRQFSSRVVWDPINCFVHDIGTRHSASPLVTGHPLASTLCWQTVRRTRKRNSRHPHRRPEVCRALRSRCP
jgi:hypothetical protein